MCMFGGDTPKPPAMPKETARSKMPDGGDVAASARRRVTDQRRAATSTILTQNGTGTLTTSGKTLLGA